ncbi:pantoate--beta-alanine ligase [Paenibacillus thermotolerans]|uniref:pantoate--beta-alanine ligase n=1 Tax=Paenibacillus thermotolerans TaxID=3027807 RepID=UPI0023684FAE|nr:MULTISPECIES: pantoate--beta-alanine ligase [unclassified Paenibacillus]
MRAVRTIREYRELLSAWRAEGLTVGYVPTMGYLHEGHLSLVGKAKEENDRTVMSIFVNPLQFGPNEDFEKYPRDEERDLSLAEGAGVDAVFLPSVEEMYPVKPVTTVQVGGVTERLCGASRPGHFAGVATVVSKLFHIVSPERAYFGMKDAQQVAVIEAMVRDLNFPVTIVPCPTLREADGLAMSSRNVYLTPEQRAQAPILYQALSGIDRWLEEQPGMTGEELERKLKETIVSAPEAVIDYVQVLSYPDLSPTEGPLADCGSFIAAVAVKFGKTRLIDNRLFHA